MVESPGAKRHPSRMEGVGVLEDVYFSVPVMTASLADVLWVREGGVGEEP